MKLRNLNYLIATLLILPLTIMSSADVDAAPKTELSLQITPLKCEVEVVNDGLQSIAYAESGTCKRVLHREHPSLAQGS